ncbi:hypothetical protein GS399_05295 [Pedobacter sp. HMF7647]|uniref:Uncharacterized protein n=1 Tax=Hufsiella arboris TaxID=2695275 RepID=A0A7K1Y7F8_9SPHI|nr:hypothetical protein [Hufsiella arboris]MXV50380.1 hypothetical protein [Hufsiella arboris]
MIRHRKSSSLLRVLPLILVFVCFISFSGKAQTDIVSGPNVWPVNYAYVGTLSYDEGNSANCQKLKIEVLGGSWGFDYIGKLLFMQPIAADCLSTKLRKAGMDWGFQI